MITLPSHNKSILGTLEKALNGFNYIVKAKPETLDQVLPGQTITGWNETIEGWFCFRLLNGKFLEINPGRGYEWIITSVPRIDAWLTMPGSYLYIQQVFWVPCNGKSMLNSLRLMGSTTLTIILQRKGGWRIYFPYFGQ